MRSISSWDRFKNAAGLHTNAIYGFQLMLSHLLERVEPSHILVAFDAGKTTFRTEMYADYKGGRAKTPDEFREQFPFIRELLDHMGIRHYELAQYEADDIIGTLDKLAEQDGFDITIVSGDKDLIQLTDEAYGGLKFPRKVWLSLRPLRQNILWKRWALHRRSLSISRRSWVISRIISLE